MANIFCWSKSSSKNKTLNQLNSCEKDLVSKPLTKEEFLAHYKSYFLRSKAIGQNVSLFDRSIHVILTYMHNLIFKFFNVGNLARNTSKNTTNLWQHYRFVHLLYLLLVMRPKVVVEFGTGVSTIFIAEILKYHNDKFF